MLEVGDIVRIGYYNEMVQPPIYGVNNFMLAHSGKCLRIKRVDYDNFFRTPKFTLFGGGEWKWSTDMFTHYANDGDNRLIPLR